MEHRILTGVQYATGQLTFINYLITAETLISCNGRTQMCNGRTRVTLQCKTHSRTHLTPHLHDHTPNLTLL